MAAQFDLVIRRGEIADGTGAPTFIGDVAIKNGVIVQVGEVAGTGTTEINASGKLVTPGFVDIHTHYDGQASWDNHMMPSSWHGVTTIVMGNCGVGFAPCRASDRGALIELMEGIEDIPGTALHEGITWTWETFEEYLTSLQNKSFDIDVCAQLPHGPLRVYVMGERAINLEDATPEDIAQMRDIARRAMDAGALGFSTSRSINHKSIKGVPTPSIRAREDELTGIALGLKDAGCGVLQWVSDFMEPDREDEYAIIKNIVRASGRPLSISVGQTYVEPDTWRLTMNMIAQAREEGLAIIAQVAPRPIGAMLGLTASFNPLQRYAAFQPLLNKSLTEQVAVMREPAFRSALQKEAESIGEASFPFSKLFPMAQTPDYGRNPNLSIAAIAAHTGRTPFEVVYDELLRDEGRALLFFAAVNYWDHNYSVIEEMLANPAAVIGLSDGGAHVGAISDASFPTSLLAIWGRDYPSQNQALDLVQLVRKQTSATAAAVGLFDRGEIVAGKKADLNVIDMTQLNVCRPEIVRDLPANGKRLLQRALGYEATIVSGVITYRNGQATGALPGKLVRGTGLARQ